MFPVLFLQGLNTRGLPMRKKIPANYINIGNDRYVHPKSTNGMKYKYHLLLDKITKLRILKSTPERKKLINKYSKERDLISDEFIKQDCYQLLDEELKDAIVGTLDDLIKKTMKENNRDLDELKTIVNNIDGKDVSKISDIYKKNESFDENEKPITPLKTKNEQNKIKVNNKGGRPKDIELPMKKDNLRKRYNSLKNNDGLTEKKCIEILQTEFQQWSKSTIKTYLK